MVSRRVCYVPVCVYVTVCVCMCLLIGTVDWFHILLVRIIMTADSEHHYFIHTFCAIL